MYLLKFWATYHTRHACSKPLNGIRVGLTKRDAAPWNLTVQIHIPIRSMAKPVTDNCNGGLLCYCPYRFSLHRSRLTSKPPVANPRDRHAARVPFSVIV